MRTAVEIQIREKYGLNSDDLLIRWVIYGACGLSIREGWPGNGFFVLYFHSWPMTSRLTAETWENHLGKDTKEKAAAALRSPCSLSRASATFCSGLENLHSQQALSFSSRRCALAHFNLSSCLSGTSATHQKATLPLLCFHKLLMLLNPIFFPSLFWNPKRTANTYSISLEGSREKSAQASCSAGIMRRSVKGVGEKY